MIDKKIEQMFDNKSKDVFFIAEIGKNFIQTEEDRTNEEYLKNAKDLIRLAKDSGADAVKFQTHVLEDEFLENISINSPHFKAGDRVKWIKRNEKATPLEFWQELKDYCDKLNIIFFTTPMSREAAKKINKIGVDLWKVGSGDILDFVLLDYIAETRKPIIISSGMSYLEEIDLTVSFLEKRRVEFALLHCVSKYPCPPEELNLNTIKFFKERYDIPIGFSDHSIGYNSSVVAASIGARIIEKHFSISRDLWGSDHKVSMTPVEFKNMVKKVKFGEKVELDDYGKVEKILLEDEAVFRPIFRKALMAGVDIKEGTAINKEMLFAMRPQKYASGLPSEKYEEVLGKKIKKDLKKFDPITDQIII